MNYKVWRTITIITSLTVMMSILNKVCAVEKSPIKTDGNIQIKLLYELKFPECIETYSLVKDKEGKLRVGNVLTLNEIYEITEKNEKSILMTRKPSGRDLQTDKISKDEWEEEKKRRIEEADWECGSVPNHFSHDGKYLFETITCGWECSKIRISNLTDNQSIDLPEGTYLSCVSENSFAGYRSIYDFKGNTLNSIPEGLLIKSHKRGFIAEGVWFMDPKGNIFNHIKHHYSLGKNFDVDYETGTTAVIIPGATLNGKPGGLPAKKSNLFFYDFKGTLIAGLELPFTGYTTGIGISYGGKYVAVLSHLGWVRLFDVTNKKELWTENFKWGGYFTDWSIPIPVSSNGFVIVHGDVDQNVEKPNKFIIFNGKGKVVGYIKSPVERSYIGYVKIKFIPETNEFVMFVGRSLSVYKISEAE